MNILETERSSDKLVSIKKVVVAVDLTKHSEATAHYAAEIAKCFNASLYVAHVFASEGFYEFGGESAYNIVDQRRQELRAQLDGLTEQVQELVPVCESVFLEGEAAGQISALARDVDADFLVSSRPHPAFLRRLFK